MPGLVGMATCKGTREHLLSTVDKMATPMLYEDSYSLGKKADSSCAIAGINLGKGDSITDVIESESHIFGFTGQVYDLHVLTQKLGYEGGGRTGSIPDLLFDAYKRFGPESLCGLNGHYVAVIWDKKTELLHIVNDRYGFKKLYYWSSGDKFVFASECKAINWLPGFPRNVDEFAFTSLLTFGYMLEDRTLFEAIKLLPPATLAVVQKGEISIKKYWDYSFHEPGTPVLSEDDYIDAFAEKITQAVKKRVSGIDRLALPLSGGLDSRTLAAALYRLKMVNYVKAYSHGTRRSYDVKFGKQIAKALGFQHATNNIEPDYIQRHAASFQYFVEGMAACDWAWEIDIQKRAFSEDGIHNVVTGFFGDVLCGSERTWNRLRDISDDETALQRIYNVYVDSFSDEEMAFYLNTDVYEKVKTYNFEVFKKTYYAAPAGSVMNRARYVSLMHYQRRFGSGILDRFESFANPLAPFSDNEFVDFILSVPVELQLGQSLYKRMLIRHFPEVVKIGYSGTGIPIQPSRLQEGLKWRMEKYGHLLKKVSLGTYGRHNHNDYRKTSHALRTASRQFVLDTFNNTVLKERFFNVERLDGMVEDFMGGKSNMYEHVCYPLTFFVWASVFLTDRRH